MDLGASTLIMGSFTSRLAFSSLTSGSAFVTVLEICGHIFNHTELLLLLFAGSDLDGWLKLPVALLVTAAQDNPFDFSYI